jgi:hypothetical protein
MLYILSAIKTPMNDLFFIVLGQIGLFTYFGSKLARALKTCVPEHKDSFIVIGMYNFEKT